MGIAVAILGSLGVAGLVMMLSEAADHHWRRSLRWAGGACAAFGVAVAIYAASDVDWTVWLIPAGVAVAVTTVVVLVS